MPEPGRLVFTVDEVAERLGVHPNTVRVLIHDGAFRARQVGRVWKIPVASLREYLGGQDNPPLALSVDDVASALGVHRDTVAKMLNAGTIRARRLGKTWKVPVSSLEEYLSGCDNPAQEQVEPQGHDEAVVPDPEQARQELEALGFRIKPRPGQGDGQPPA